MNGSGGVGYEHLPPLSSEGRQAGDRTQQAHGAMVLAAVPKPREKESAAHEERMTAIAA
jgi:hypothetical protein